MEKNIYYKKDIIKNFFSTTKILQKISSIIKIL